MKELEQTTKTIREMEENLSKVHVLLVAKEIEVVDLTKSLQSIELMNKELEEELISLKKQKGEETKIWQNEVERMNREMEAIQLMNQQKEEDWKLQRDNLLKQLADKDNQVVGECAKAHSDMSKEVEKLKELLTNKTMR